MSFSIDLWNGYNAIRDKYINMRMKLRSFSNFLTKYNTYETQHCKNLDSLYNEFKEQNIQQNSSFEKARLNLIEMIHFESQTRKMFIEEVAKIFKKINLFLQDLKNPYNEIPDLSEMFNKEIEKLNSKRDIFYNQCKEMSSLISQFELENKLNDKNNEQKLNKVLNKLIKSRDEYLLNINETNIKRNTYNSKVGGILDKYEKEHRTLLKCFFDCVNEFKTKKYELANELISREKADFLNLFHKLKEEDEILDFIISNATREFPMVQIEFSSFKKKDFETFLNSKYHNKLKSNDLKRIMTAINDYFRKNNIFTLNFIQTGITRAVKQTKGDFYRKISIFQKFNNTNENTGDKNSKEKEVLIIQNYLFIKNILNELITNNKITLFESKYLIEGNILKSKEEIQKFENINDKIQELKLLLNEKNESHLVYIEALIKTLSYLRSKGCFEINEEAYNVVTEIFTMILEQNMNNDYILKNILILAQTFYKIENKSKIYLQEGIRGNKVLNLSKTWHRCINYSLSLANKDFKYNSKKEYIDKINKEAYSTVITYLCDIKSFSDDEAVYESVLYFYMKLYNLKEEDIKAAVEKSVKSRKEKSKSKKIEKNEKGETTTINEIKNEIKTDEFDKNKTTKEADKNENKTKDSDKNNKTKEEDKNEIKVNNSDKNKIENKNGIKVNDLGQNKIEKEIGNKNEIKVNNVEQNKIEKGIENKNEIKENNLLQNKTEIEIGNKNEIKLNAVGKDKIEKVIDKNEIKETNINDNQNIIINNNNEINKINNNENNNIEEKNISNVGDKK